MSYKNDYDADIYAAWDTENIPPEAKKKMEESGDLKDLWNLSIQELERKLGLSADASSKLLQWIREPLNKEIDRVGIDRDKL